MLLLGRALQAVKGHGKALALGGCYEEDGHWPVGVLAVHTAGQQLAGTANYKRPHALRFMRCGRRNATRNPSTLHALRAMSDVLLPGCPCCWGPGLRTCRQTHLAQRTRRQGQLKVQRLPQNQSQPQSLWWTGGQRAPARGGHLWSFE